MGFFAPDLENDAAKIAAGEVALVAGRSGPLALIGVAALEGSAFLRSLSRTARGCRGLDLGLRDRILAGAFGVANVGAKGFHFLFP
jgi:hypothetical protein